MSSSQRVFAEDRKVKITAKVRPSEQRQGARVVDFASPEGEVSVAGSSDGQALVVQSYDARGTVRFQLPDGSAIDVGSGKIRKRTRFASADDVANWGADLIPLDHEEVWALGVDNAGKLKAAYLVASSGIDTVQLDPRKVMRLMLHESAVAFILVHNHPSGSSKPSQDDIRTTKRLSEIGDQVGVKLLDHVIVARDGHSSFLQMELM